MPKWLSVPEFRERLAKYRQISYKKVLGYAEADVLPTMPRYGGERIRIKFCREVLQFLIDEGLEEHQIRDILTGWKG